VQPINADKHKLIVGILSGIRMVRGGLLVG